MEFVLKIVFVLLLVGIAALVAHIVDLVRNKTKNSMSFRESMDLTDLPVVTFRQGRIDSTFCWTLGLHYLLLMRRCLII